MSYTPDTTVEGWMSERELLWLYNEAANSKSVVELGCWKGRSAKALLDGCPGRVLLVDDFSGGILPAMQAEAQSGVVLSTLRENLKGYKYDLTMENTVDAAKTHANQSFDMTFIDANHNYEAVSADIENWLPMTKRLICGHDYDEEGVRRAVTEKLGSVGVIGSIWYKYLNLI